MIRKAEMKDLRQIMKIIELTIIEMKKYNNTQWDENYPVERDFINDINKGELYVDDEENIIKGFICINYIEPEEYRNLAWTSDEKCMVIHRMAVNPENRNQGVGSGLMSFAEALARDNGVYYLKTDTYSINEKMNSLFSKFNYRCIGQMSFLCKERPFNCYEKNLLQKI